MKTKICILVISNQPEVFQYCHFYLSPESYNVINTENSIKGIELAGKLHPHLIIIDEILPDLEGIETIKKLKEIPELLETKVIFLTGHCEDQNQITAYEAGVDDVITSIKPKVLISKIKALVRNFKYDETIPNIVTLGNLVINREEYTIITGESKFDLPRKEFELISLLASRPGEVFNREEIFNKIWGTIRVRGSSIEVKIKNLRDKVGRKKIVTVKGERYKILP